MEVAMEQFLAEVRELRKEKETTNPEGMEVILAEIREMKKSNQTSHPIDVVAVSLNKDNVSLLTGARRDGGSLLSMNSSKAFQLLYIKITR